MGARRHAVETIFALAVGNDIRAIFHVQTHAGDAQFVVVLAAIAIAIQEHFADHKRFVAEHARLHRDFDTCDIGARVTDQRLSAVDAVALHCANTGADAIG